MSKPIELGFLGCGNIGCGVWNLLRDFSGDIEHRTGLTFHVKSILVKDPNKKRNADVPRELLTTRVEDVIHDPEIQIILEFLGGDEPAHQWIIRALQAGKTVVTANKVAFALHWTDLQAAAKETGAGLYYEAAVCGAIPIIHALEASLQANKIDKVYGIVNGTTNYILTRMSREGASYQEVLADAQRLGLAEPDPSSDVEGFDAAYKLSILSSLAFHGRIPFENVYIEGITRIAPEDIAIGRKFGYTLKLLAISKREGLMTESRVHPTFIRMDHPMANVLDAYNAVFLHGHACGDMMFMGKGAGDMPTAGAIVSDLIRAATTQKHLYPTFEHIPNPNWALQNNPDWSCAFYLRILAEDRPGVLSAITQIFAEHDISIAAMEQESVKRGGKATLTFITHQARESNMRIARELINQRVGTVESLIRVEE